MSAKPWIYLLFLTLPFFAGCSSDGNTTSIAFPNVDAECFPAQATSCDINGHARTIRVGLVAGNTGVNCGEVITAVGSEFFAGFRASGEVTSTFDGTDVSGTITSWVDGDNAAITTIDAGTYTICSYIDINQDGLLNSGEPVASEVTDIALLDQLIDEWGDF